MRYGPFREHKIERSCKVQLKPYSKYRPYLKKDFHDRCCYCNMPRDLLTIPYHIEHFVPISAFQGKKDEWLTDYENLMWACPKCNLSKGDKYEGDLSKIENKLFYNPVETNYNDIFYRNELGGIASDDEKGQNMIKLLKLYRPIHNLAWLIERMERLVLSLENEASREVNEERKELLERAAGKLAVEYMKKYQLFRAVYNGKRFEEIYH